MSWDILPKSNLQYFLTKLKGIFDNKVDKETGKGLFSGSYNDLTNKPTIPAAQVNSDWNASSGVAQILNKPTIPDTSDCMKKGVDRVTAGQSIIAPIGTASTADGFAVNASGDYSHASGYQTIASSDMQHVIGKYNEEDANGTYAFIVGGGRLDFDRKNIFTIDWNGDVNAGRSNGLTNDTKLPTGADVISYLNSNLGKYFSAQSTTVVTMDAYVFYPILSLSLPAGVYIIVGSAREEGDGTGTSRRLLNINTVASFTTETPGTQTFSSFSPTHATTSLILSLNSQTTVYLNAFSDDNGAKVTHCYLRAVKLSP